MCILVMMSGRMMAHDVANFAKEVYHSKTKTLSPSDFPGVVESGVPWMIDFFSPVGHNQN